VPLSRREVIVGGAAVVTVAACTAPSKPDAGPPHIDPQPYDQATHLEFSPESVALSEALFPQTVSSGVMKTDSVLLWTRAVGEAQVVLRVWRDVGSATEIALVHERTVDVPVESGDLKLTVGSLAPATWYRYAFFSTDLARRSPIGQVRTAFPDDWNEPLTIGATSCASYRYRPFKPLVTLAQQPMDLWLHLGDVAYNDGADSLPLFRQKWAEQFTDPGYRALMPAAGAYLVWDDHDFANNFDPEALGPTNPLLLDGKTAFRETLPVEEDRSWKSYRWGRTAEFFLLDLRMERKPSTRQTPDAQFISPEQLAWVQQALLESPCHFKVILSSVPISALPPPSWGGSADRWEGYPAQREKFLAFLDASGLDNVWFISGDIHVGTIMRLEKTGPRRKYFEICAGPAGNINPLTLVLEPGQEMNKKLVFPPEQFLYAGGGFQATTLTFDPQANTVRVKFLDPAQGDAVTCDQTLRFGEGA
jgi:alkaline phosphatase D